MKIRSETFSVKFDSNCQHIKEELFKGLDALGRFSAIFYKEDNFCDFLFAFLNTNHSEKDFTLKVL